MVWALASLCVTTGARAQDADEQTPPTLVVRSRPSGADVRISGDRLVLGRTPFTLERPLAGRYHLAGSAPGWETWRRTLDLSPGRADTVWMTLRPKHAVMGAARSLVLPGWGSFYAEHPVHGWTIVVGDGVAAIVALVTQKQYRDKADLYESLNAEAERIGAPPGSGPRLLAEAAREDRDAARDVRNGVLIGAAGWWGASVLDALLFGPPPARAPAPVMGMAPGGARIGLGMRF